MSKLWTETAARDRLHPVVIGFVWGSPSVLREHIPGTWDAVSDCFTGNRLSQRAAGHMLNWTKNASEFLSYARICEELPSPSSVVTGRSRFPVARPLCVTMVVSVMQWLEAKSRKGEAGVGVMTRDFLARVLDEMPPEAASVAVSAALRWYDLPLADRDLVMSKASAVLGTEMARS
jgi:hypothetical protein